MWIIDNRIVVTQSGAPLAQLAVQVAYANYRHAA